MKTVPLDHVKKSIAVSLTSLLFIAASSSFADDTPQLSSMQQDLDNISIYLQNLGMYYGYDLTNYCPTANGNCPGSGGNSGPTAGSGGFTNELTNPTATFASEIDLITGFLGSILLPSAPNPAAAGATAASTTSTQLVPTTLSLSPSAALINTYQNQSFAAAQKIAYPGPNPGAFSASPLIDQSPYQSDPVNQAILNILSTPDVSYCVNSITGGPYPLPCKTGTTIAADGTIQNNSGAGGGPVLSQVQIMLNTIGAFPSGADTSAGSVYPATNIYSLPAQNASLLPQLNSDTLLGPLIFDNPDTTSSGGSTPPPSDGQGLTATSQIEQAANYIRYATSSVNPITQPNATVYGALYTTAVSPTATPAAQLAAQSTIANYLTNLRVYAAQASVGISNLYSILAKRMPQNSIAANGQKTSPALSEYLMATWRLQPQTSNSSTNQTWTAQINTASSATVEKEIAILLAEINYQLYLGRVQQERSLLTETTMLLQAAKNTQPDSRLAAPPGADTAGSAAPGGGGS